MDSIVEIRKRRLIVLIPQSLADSQELANKIYWIAVRDHCGVIYVAIVDNEEHELQVSRSMATLKAVTASGGLDVQYQLVTPSTWIKKVRSLYRSGDRIVCQQEQLVKNGFMHYIPIADHLENTMGMQVVTIAGLYHPKREMISRWLRSIASWFGFLLIIAGFSVLEFRVDLAIHGYIGKILLCMLVIIELWAIWIWNQVTG